MTAEDPPTESRPAAVGIGDAHAALTGSGEVTTASGTPDHPHPEESSRAHTRLSGYWSAIVVGLIVLLVLVIFILNNSQKVKVSFFGAHAHLAEGVALLLAAVIGGLVVVFAGMARILQLRARAHRTARSDRRSRRGHRK